MANFTIFKVGLGLEEMIHITTADAAAAEAWRNQMHEFVYHYVVAATAEKNMSIASLLGSAAAPTNVCCLATCFEHDASAAQVEVTKRGNILIIIWNCTVLVMMGKIKFSGGRVRWTSLMLIFLFSRATGQYCTTYFRLLATAVAFLCQSLHLPKYSKAIIFSE